jgi:hypothetical protein
VKNAYHSPAIVEYGRFDQLTQGATGPKVDFRFINGQLIVDNNNPTCQTNSTACVRFS